MMNVIISDVDEIKLMCSLHEMMISDEVMISYVSVKLVSCLR